MKLSQKLSFFILVALAVFIVSCSPSLKVTHDYDKSADFTKYKTFAIDTFRQVDQISQLNRNRIINAVKSVLTQKGFTESSTPDMLVNITAILKDKQSVSSTTNYYGYGGYYRPYAWGGGMGASGYTTYDVQNYKDGSIIVDIADAKTKNLLWEGIGNKELDKPAADPDAAINTAMTSIMASFPPGAAAKK